jgi:hypothetical protein
VFRPPGRPTGVVPEARRAGADILGLIATLLMGSAGCPPERVRSSTIESTPSRSAADVRQGHDESIADFAERYRREVDDLGRPAQLFLSHESVAPRGFVDLARRRPRARPVASARMFVFDFADPVYGSCGDGVVQPDGTICSSAVYPGTALTQSQTEGAAAILRAAPASWSARVRSRCFDPHHAVVFFDDKGAPVGELTTCFACGTLRVRPGPADDALMTDEAGAFFADTCRALGVGACPPARASRVPDLLPSAESTLSEEAARPLRVRRALARDHGVPLGRQLGDLSSVERNVLCAWLDSGMRIVAPGGRFTCKDGRTIVRAERRTCEKMPSASCGATVGDLTMCLRARLDPLCGGDSPGCANSDRCHWGVFEEQDAGSHE